MTNINPIYDEITELTSEQMEASRAMTIADLDTANTKKLEQVMRFIEANTNYPLRALVDKFGLDWSLGKDLGNGVGVVDFYTGADQRAVCLTMHLPISEWFRG